MRGRGRVRTVVLASLLGLALVAPVGPPAYAAVPPVSPRTSGVVTADALPTAQVNGVVWTTLITGSRLFAAGEFTSARPAGSAPGSNERRRWNLVSVNLGTGALEGFAPQLNGPVRALAVSGDGTTLFVGGTFTKVGSVTRNRFAAFRISDGRLLAPRPSFNATVTSLAVRAGTVYAGGYFNAVNGVSRSRLAAVVAADGALTAWAPKADGDVRALAVTGDKTKVIVGGHFNYVNNQPGRGLVALDARSGASRTWRINTVVKDYGRNAAILSLHAAGDTVYGTGYAYGDGNFEGAFAADQIAGDVRWLQACRGDTYDVAYTAGAIYSVGHAHSCDGIGGFPEASPRRHQRALAVTRSATGTVAQTSDPRFNFGGQPGPSLYNWFPELNAGTYTGLAQGPWTVATSASYVVLAGEFTRVNGRPQQGIVRFTLPSRQPVVAGPVDRSAATAPTVAGLAGGQARVSWRANWDRDEMDLGYELLRDGVVVGRVTRRSTFWNRPVLSLTDRGLVAGRTYRYQVRVTHRADPALSPAVSFRYADADAAAAAEAAEARSGARSEPPDSPARQPDGTRLEPGAATATPSGEVAGRDDAAPR